MSCAVARTLWESSSKALVNEHAVTLVSLYQVYSTLSKQKVDC